MTTKGKTHVENMAAVMHVIPSNHADKRVHVRVRGVCVHVVVPLGTVGRQLKSKPSRVRTMCAVEIIQLLDCLPCVCRAAYNGRFLS